MMSQRRTSQRRYLASLVGTEDTTLLGASKPFTVSLPFTIPRKAASAPSQESATSSVAQDRGRCISSVAPAAMSPSGNPSVAEPPRSLLPQPPPAAPAVPERRRNGGGALGPVTTRKMALQLPETEYDGSETSFVALLMSRLRQQCDALVDNAEAPWNLDTMPRSHRGDPDRLVVHTPSAAAATATLWEEVDRRNRKTALRSLPVDLLLHVLSYCPVVDLCRLSCTARRIHAIVSSSVVWIPICARFHLRYERVPNTFDFVKDPRVLVREYLVSIRRSLDRQLEEQQTALRDIEQRLNQRAEALAPFSRQLVQEVNGVQQQHPALIQVLERTEQRLDELTRATESWDVLRGTIIQSLQENKSILVDNQRVLRALWSAVRSSDTVAGQTVQPSFSTSGNSVVHTASRVPSWIANAGPSPLDAAEVSEEDTRLLRTTPFSCGIPRRQPTEPFGSSTSIQDANGSVVAPSHRTSALGSALVIDKKLLDKMERRVSRLVLAPCRDLPVIVRRGIESFSAMELLVSQLLPTAPQGTAPPPPPVPSPVATNFDTGSATGGGTMLAARWSKWKQFFPVGSLEYADIRDAVADDAGGVLQWSQRLAPCAAMIRKVCSLTDDELEAVVFEQN